MSASRRRAFWRLVPALLLLLPALARAQGPRVVDPSWLSARLADRTVVVLHVAMDHDGPEQIPGARSLPYDALVTRRGSLGSELPAPDDLRRTFEALGVSDASTVVVYAHEAPMATRALFSLAYLGVRDIAYLDGGLERWRAEGHPVARAGAAPARGRITTPVNDAVVADAAYIQTRLGTSGIAFLDTRTTGEYVGTGNRSGMPSAGHLAGAHQLEWQSLFSDGSTRLKPRAELEAMFRERVMPGDSVVTYCWVGYRASATWFIARVLGFEARMYDGSYQDWSQRALPTRGGASP